MKRVRTIHVPPSKVEEEVGFPKRRESEEKASIDMGAGYMTPVKPTSWDLPPENSREGFNPFEMQPEDDAMTSFEGCSTGPALVDTVRKRTKDRPVKLLSSKVEDSNGKERRCQGRAGGDNREETRDISDAVDTIEKVIVQHRANDGNDAMQRRKELLEKKPHATPLSRDRIVYGREEDNHDRSMSTVVIRDVNKVGLFSKFGARDEKTIRGVFYAVLQLINENKEALSRAVRFRSEQLFLETAEDWYGTDDEVDNVPEFRVVEREQNHGALAKQITVPMIGGDQFLCVALNFGERGVQLSLANFDSLGHKCGVFLFISEGFKLIRYLNRRFDFVPEQRRRCLLNEEDDAFF